MVPVLRFIHIQCKHSAKYCGWAKCSYGKDAKSLDWQCNKNDTQYTDCQGRSPLMSYLSGCLPGHLHHQLNSVGCNFVCSTCPTSQRGMPCLTPLGFRAFSCSKRKGKDICEVLEDICGDGGVLTKLSSSLTCLLGLPPRCFPDIFAFYYQLTRMWNEMPKTPNGLDDKCMQKPICLEIINTVGCNYDTAKTFLDSCRNLYDSPSHFMHEITAGYDLGYLVGCNKQSCGNVTRPLNSSAYSVFASTYAERYLSWLVYICPQLVSFLTQLKESFGDLYCYDSLCSPCLNRDGCTKGKHVTSPCGCKSIVHCRGVSSVLYRYGLTYADVADRSQIRCHDFCTALDNMLK
ncbi:hypothetical protein BBBOND_0208590 [Babesia bigemina]|uniref:Uncharacterized protein n=1 Tax=Babesia bigemina TaxID=5866 RepID=A0A061DCQ0_BABBI|nr:hypothetical protein BBBOND_0208590 [Babesia bigemina]CDR95705.1 hypothetical protein BBBOND_0208590 [Babesia bigemina]|eukprot:XP_012767891.1 hypothetical protein BBBOND_0208590 [Babesia bigemina]